VSETSGKDLHFVANVYVFRKICLFFAQVHFMSNDLEFIFNCNTNKTFPYNFWICLMSSKMEASMIEECMCIKISDIISYNLNMALTTNTPYLLETSRMTGNFQASLCSYVYSLLRAAFTPHMQYVCNAYIICSRTMMLIEPTSC